MAIISLLRRSARTLISLGIAAACSVGHAAVSTPQIQQSIDNQLRTTLRGNVRPLPRGAQDMGAVAANTPASRVLLLLKRPAAQEAAFERYIADAHTAGTARYHKWLTPAQIGNQYGPADADIQTVVSWLGSQGFAVAKVSAAKTSIEFSGTAGQIQKAFATRIHTFQVNGETHISNVTDPQIPSALAPVVAGISPLNDFHARPMHTATVASRMTPASSSARVTAVPALRGGGPLPQYTSSSGYYLVTPADAATIYDVPNKTLNAAYTGTSLTGSGVTIGIAGTSNVDLSNVTNYRALFGLPALTPSVIIDGSDPGRTGDAEVEALLDIEASGAIAPGANLNLYIAQATSFQDGLTLAIQRAIDDNAINILNVSFGACEAAEGQSGNHQLLNLWQQAAAQGISVTVSSGDNGAAGCDDFNAETSAAQGLQVSGFASTPYNIAVGGTDFNESSANISTYWNATNSAIGGSAKSYIPEIPWNDSTSTVGSLAGNVALRDGNGNTNIVGASGGVSGCLTSTLDQSGNVTACSNSYARPTWQSGFGVKNARQIPDVSLFAADAQSGHLALWSLCASGLSSSDPAGEVDCVKDANGAFSLKGVGGTSASAPAFAGVLALVIQQLQNAGATNLRLGQVDYTLYPLSKQFPSAFHDITTGNNSVVCSASPASSPNDCGSNGFLIGYDAGAGYDLASGLGTLDVTQLVQSWSKLSFQPTTTALQLNGSSSSLSITHGTSVNVTASVTSSGGTPTGSIALVNSGSSTPPAGAVQGTTGAPGVFTLSNGSVNGTDAYLPGGTYTVKANYNGDGSFGPSVSNGVNVTVSAEPSTLALSVQAFPYLENGQGVSANGITVPYGTYVSVAAQPLSSAQAQSATSSTIFSLGTGTVTFASATTALNQTVGVNSNGFAEVPGQTTLAYVPGSYSVSASYSGDASFSSSTAAAQTFTITKASAIVLAASSVNNGGLLVQVDSGNLSYFTNSGAALPTGTVTVTSSSGATLGTATLASVAVQGGTVAQATVNIGSASTSGFTITYSGDSNYTGNASPYNAGVGAAYYEVTSAVSASSDIVAFAKGSSGTSTISVTPKNGFNGTVKLTCSVNGSGTTLPGCSFANASLSVSGTNASTTTLTVNGVVTTADLQMPSAFPGQRWYAAGGAALAGLLVLGLPRRRRAWQRMLSLMILLAATGFAGCGGSSSSGSGGGGGAGGGSSVTVPSGAYEVIVTATSGSQTQTASVYVQIQ